MLALFKPVIVNARGLVQGENWSEKLSAEIAQLLGVPAARIDLAHRRGHSGIVSYDVRTVQDRSDHAAAFDLVSGADLLMSLDPEYVPGRHRQRGRPGHALPAIRRALADYHAPPLNITVTMGAFDIFAGFLVLDALIANQDRHDENWAVLRGATSEDASQDCVAPSFDHASSLGFNLDDDRRARELSRGIETWARRGAATRFEFDPSGKPASLVACAASALAMVKHDVRKAWLDRVESLDLDRVAALADRIGPMSDLARRFAVALIDTNRRRLLDECHRA